MVSRKTVGQLLNKAIEEEKLEREEVKNFQALEVEKIDKKNQPKKSLAQFLTE
jgi:glucuronate isomerase